MALAYQGVRHGFASGRTSNQRILGEEVCRGGCKPQTVLRTLAAFLYCSHHRILDTRAVISGTECSSGTVLGCRAW
jgi:hypothetical protein